MPPLTQYNPISEPSKDDATRDSFELASLASSSSRSSLSEASSRSGISSSRRLSVTSDPENENASANRTNRSYSVSSAFDFNSHLIPLSTSSADPSAYHRLPGALSHISASSGPPLEKQKSLSFINGLSLLLGLQIGSGIFSSPSQVNNHAGSPGMSLVIWFIAGVLAWTGAASYAELGGAIPLNGGAQAYLRYCYGEGVAFIFAWAAIIVMRPGATAIIAIIFGEYFNRVIFSGGSEEKVSENGVISSVNQLEWMNKCAAILALLFVTLINALSTKLTTRMSDFFMFIKVGSLVAITIIGIIVAVTGLNSDGTGANKEWRDRNWFTPIDGNGTATLDPDGTPHVGFPSISLGELALALYAGLFAYDGWDNVNYVAGEMRRPQRDLPRTIHTAMLVVIICYLLANVSYYLVLPSQVISQSNTVAVAFGAKVFGKLGGLVFALAVSLSCFGALNATTFTAGRLVYVAGKEGYLPSVFGMLGFRGSYSRHYRDINASSSTSSNSAIKLYYKLRDYLSTLGQATPIYATFLNCLITVIFILLGDFSTLLTFYGVAGYTFYFLTVLGLIILRMREPSLERPYKTWITTPIVFCCVSLFLISRGVFAAPMQTMLVCGFVGMGVPIYYWRVGGGWKGWKEDLRRLLVKVGIGKA